MLCLLTIVMDILWIVTMRNVWASKPLKNASSWGAFDNIRGLTILLSVVNIALKGIGILLLWGIKDQAKKDRQPNMGV